LRLLRKKKQFAQTPEKTRTKDTGACNAAHSAQAAKGKGIVVSIVDILLCAVVMKREWAIFTTDPDFRNYAKVLPLSIHGPRK
jgi:predicted nucleic acid-binding protein